MTILRRPLADRFWARVQKTPTCWVWLGHIGTTGLGYGYLSIHVAGRKKMIPQTAHRISWEIHHGPIPPGMWVLHRCDNPPCVNPNHLYLGTPADNMHDRSERGRAPKGINHPLVLHPERAARGDKHGYALHPEKWLRGESHPLAKIDEATANIIRNSPEPGVVLAQRYHISPTAISRIRKGKTWKLITPPAEPEPLQLSPTP